MLKISADLKLPADFVTQVCAILARRGAGKSYTACVLAEEMIKEGLQVCIVDPIGVWYGLRTSADGKHDGLPVVIFGGDHGDLPLESTAGALIADVVMDKKISAVIDLSLMRKGEQDRFVCDFAERIYYKNRSPIHLILDEADSFAPQKPMPGQQRMLGAVEDLARKGRARGIGLTMVTQRSAVINKNLLSQAEVLICLQTIAPQDRMAVLTWVEAHGSEEECKIMMSSLAVLSIGEAWVWSPAWAKCFKQVKIRKRETFDSSSTPKVGAKKIEPKKLAAVEIESLKVQMAAVIEKKKQDDPRELRKEIAALKAELAKKAPTQKVEKVVEKRVEIPVLPSGAVNRLEKFSSRVSEMTAALLEIQKKVAVINGAKLAPAPSRTFTAFGGGGGSHPTPPGGGGGAGYVTKIDPKANVKINMPWSNPKPKTEVEGEFKLDKCKRAILTVLAQYQGGKTREQIAVIAGYSHKGGSFGNAIYNLRANGLIAGDEPLLITDYGLSVLGEFTPLPTGDALAQHWCSQLDKCKKLILQHLMSIHPNTATREEIGAATGYDAAGGSFGNSIYNLRSLGLIEGKKDLKAADNLFGE